jgi:hypothetical protein
LTSSITKVLPKLHGRERRRSHAIRRAGSDGRSVEIQEVLLTTPCPAERLNLALSRRRTEIIRLFEKNKVPVEEASDLLDALARSLLAEETADDLDERLLERVREAVASWRRQEPERRRQLDDWISALVAGKVIRAAERGQVLAELLKPWTPPSPSRSCANVLVHLRLGAAR